MSSLILKLKDLKMSHEVGKATRKQNIFSFFWERYF